MPNTPFYPKLKRLLSPADLPQALSFAKEPLDGLLDKIQYRNLIISKDRLGDKAFYSAQLFLDNRIDIEIPGTGIAFVFNPPPLTGPQGTSAFDVTVFYKWEVVKYIRAFQFNGFAFTPDALLNLFFDLFNIDDEDILYSLIQSFTLEDFIQNNPATDQRSVYDHFQTFISEVNSRFGSSLDISNIQNPDFSDIIAVINASTEVSFAEILSSYIADSVNNLEKLIKPWLTNFNKERLTEIIIPEFNARLDNISVGIEFPRQVLIPVDQNNDPISDPNIKSFIRFNVGSLNFSSVNGAEFKEEFAVSFDKSQIGNTGITLSFSNMKLDLSRKKNIPEAIADGRPDDFVGVFIQNAEIGLPKKWFKTPTGTTAEIFGQNLLIGTGGISGKLGIRPSSLTPPPPNTDPVLPLVGDPNDPNNGFYIGLKEFDVELRQGSFIRTDIHGELRIPGFEINGSPAILDVDVSFDNKGDFAITVSEEQGIEALEIPDVLKIIINSLSVGRKNDRFFIAVSGLIDFAEQPNIGKFLPDDIDIKRLIIWDDGSIELEGGTIVLPKAVSFKLGPADISITAIGLGSHEQFKGTALRKYRYFEFSGGVSVKPGGIDARGDGVKFFYSIDDPNDVDVFIRIQGIRVDLILPGNAKPEDAALIVKGYLSMKNPDTNVPNPDTGTEYVGGVEFALPKAKLAGSAAMKMNPKVPSFLVDVGLELATPIPVGPTGLGIYGFRGLFGRRYVVSKTAVAGLTQESSWYEYYKAPEEGIEVPKFSRADGFSLGAGVSLATASDGGKVFSSKIFFMVSLPGVFLLQGQAAILRQRIGLDPGESEPPFSLLVAVTKESITADFGVNYRVPEETGKLLKVDALMETGFFFGNANAWCINIGRELPETKRIHGRIFDLFDVYAYLMISKVGIRAGAGASYHAVYKPGPITAELNAYLDVFGKINFHPKQIGGGLRVGGSVRLAIWKFGFNLSAALSMSAEVPKPFYISGQLEVCIRILKKDRCVRIQLTWIITDEPNTTEIILHLEEKGAIARNVLTQETFPLLYSGSMLPSGIGGIGEQHIIPLDSYIDIEFLKPISPENHPSLTKIGGPIGQENTDIVSVDGNKSKTAHRFTVSQVSIYHWNGSAWQAFDIYDALSPLSLPGINIKKPADPRFGYWQLDSSGRRVTKLSLLATSPLEYTRRLSSPPIVEDFGVTGKDLFCPPVPAEKICIDFDDFTGSTVKKETLTGHKKIVFILTGADGTVQTVTNPFGFNKALKLEPGSTLEIILPEPTAIAELTMTTLSDAVTVSWITRGFSEVKDANNSPLPADIIIKKDVLPVSKLIEPVVYQDGQNPIDKILIEAGPCTAPDDTVTCELLPVAGELQDLLNVLVVNGKLTATDPALDLEQQPYIAVYGKTLYSYLRSNRDHFYTTDFNGSASTSLHITIGPGPELVEGCHITLTAPSTIDYSKIIGLSNIRPDTALAVSGDNFSFLADASVSDNGLFIITLSGVSDCYPVSRCHGRNLDYKSLICTLVRELITKIEERITVLIREKTISQQICTLHSDGDCRDTGLYYCYQVTIIEKEIFILQERIVTLTEYLTLHCVPGGGGDPLPCGTFVFEICRLSKRDYDRNQNQPTFNQILRDNHAMLDALNNSLQPVWRPDTYYAVQVVTKDSLSGKSFSAFNYTNTHTYAFRTAGPVGHFHKVFDGISTDPSFIPAYQTLLNADKADEFRLSTLRDYIDYDKSYPNADGNVINAKPLFYDCPKLLLFFVSPHVYTMFHDFDAYNGLPQVESKLDVVIKDPVEPPTQANPLLGEVNWVENDIPRIPTDVQLLNNLMNGDNCSGLTPIKPKGINVNVDLCGKLKPLKLYTAIYKNVYNRASMSASDAQEVHRYVFQTSQYKDFKEQVESFLIKDEAGAVKKKAFFDIAKSYTQIEIDLIKQIIDAAELLDPTNTDLTEFAHPYDRLVDKALGLEAMNPALTTEFNMIIDSSEGNPTSGNVLGILIRNSEPFNDPKLPPEVLKETIQVVTDATGNIPDPDYKVIFSKDGSRAFLTHTVPPSNLTDLNISGETIFIRFQYLEFNGKEYVLNNAATNQVVTAVQVKAPVTQLSDADCGKTEVDINDTLTAELIEGAIGYEFVIEHPASSFSASYTRNDADGKFPLYEAAGIRYNKTYDVKVRPILPGRITKFGPVCQISTKVLAFVIINPLDVLQGESAEVRIEVQDINGNINYEFTEDVTLEVSGNATVPDNGLVDIVNGVGTILVSDDTVETVELTLSDTENTDLDVTSTQDVSFTVAPATKLVIVDPVDTVQGMQALVSVLAKNDFGDTDTNFNGTVTLHATGSATVSNNGIVPITGGSGAVQVSDNVPETVTLSLEDTGNTGLDVTSTQDIVFAVAAATKFIIADPSDSVQGVAVTVTVTARNDFGYIDPNFQDDVTLIVSGNAATNPFNGLVNIVNGVGTIEVNDTTVETVQLSLNDSENTGLDVTSTQDVVFGIAPATKFIIVDPADSIQGQAITVTVEARNQFNTLDTNYQSDVTLNASGGSAGSPTGAGLVDIVNGVGTRQINDTTAETVTLSLSDTQGTGLDVTSTQDVVFGIAPATKFVIIDPSDSVQGQAVTVTVQAQNQFDTLDTNYQSDVTLNASGGSAGSPTGAGLVDIVNGVGTRQINDTTAETVTLTLSDSQGTGLDVTSTQQVVFGIAPATKFVIIDPPDSVQGQAVTVTVQAQNQFNTIDTAYQSDVTLNVSGDATGAGLVDIVNGVGTRQINDTTPETVTLSLSDTQGTGLDVSSTQDVVFGIAPATKFVILDPSDSVQGQAVTVTVQAQNQFGTLDTAYQSDVTLNASGNATGEGLVDIVNGVGTKSINDNTAETVQLTLSDTQSTGLDVSSTQDVVFAIAPATKFVILDPANSVVGAPVTVTVQAMNDFNLVDPNYQNDVTLNASGNATGDGLVDIVNGIGSRQINDTTAETVTLTLTDSEGTGLDVTSTQDVIFATALIFQDSFTEPGFSGSGDKQLNLHVPDIGLSWTQLINVNSSAGIKVYNANDRIFPTDTVGIGKGSFYGANVSGGYATSNYEAEIKSVDTGSNAPLYLGVRVSSDGQNGYFVRFTTSGSQVYKRVGGTWTAIGSAGGSVADNTVVKLQIIGTTIKFFIGGSLSITVTDSSISATGQAGVGMGRMMTSSDNEAGQFADDFKVTLV